MFILGIIAFLFHVCEQLFIVLVEEFRMFCQDDLKLDSKVELYDPLYKKFEFFVDINIDGCFVLFSLAEFFKYYGLNNNYYVHFSYIGNNIFLYKIFLAERTQILYERVSSDLLNNDGNTSTGNDTHPVFGNGLDNGNHNLTKKLTQYDVEASCLVCKFFIVFNLTLVFCFCWFV